MVSVKKIPPLVLAAKITSTLTLLHLNASQLQAVIHGNTWMVERVMNWTPTQVLDAMTPRPMTGHITSANGLAFASTTRLNLQLEYVSTIPTTQV